MAGDVRSQLNSLARNSGLFSTASLHELHKKRDSNSVLAMGQIPGEKKKGGPKLIHENTYQLEPKKKFQSDKVKAIVDSVLESQLKDETYDPKACKQTSLTLCEIIKSRVKELDYERYKIVCVVSIGQLKDQGLRMASRCCWDPNWDNYATGNFTNKTLYAVATVWGVYYE